MLYFLTILDDISVKKIALYAAIFVTLLLFLKVLFIASKTTLVVQLIIGLTGAVIGSASTHLFNRYLNEERQDAMCIAALLQTLSELGIQMEEITSINSLVNTTDTETKLGKFPAERLDASRINLPYQIFISKKLKKKTGKLFASKNYKCINDLSRCSRICLEIKSHIDNRNEVRAILMNNPPTTTEQEGEKTNLLTSLTEKMYEDIRTKIKLYFEITPGILSTIKENIEILDHDCLPSIEINTKGNPVIDLLPSNT